MRRGGLAIAGLIAIAAGCGGGDGSPEAARQPAKQTAIEGSAARGLAVKPVPCPARAEACRSARGVILYVERVDPDGDGDAHFVLSSSEAITAPGISVIDVPRELRPHPLPVPGDLLAAAGPVYTGSYGQRQIQAIELTAVRR